MNNEHMENEERQIMTFLDEEGNKVEFEAVARIFLEEKEYLLLAPADDTESEELNLVEDDREFLAVKKEYKKLLY